MTLTTLEMEIALMKFFDTSKNLIVPNVSWGLGLNECDLLILNKSGYATEIEIKVSKADLIRDRQKKHEHNRANVLVKDFYFAVPYDLIADALSVMPKRAGLYGVKKYYDPSDKHQYYDIRMIDKAKSNIGARAWSDKNRCKLAYLGALRILKLKQKALRLEKVEKAFKIFMEDKKK